MILSNFSTSILELENRIMASFTIKNQKDLDNLVLVREGRRLPKKIHCGCAFLSLREEHVAALLHPSLYELEVERFEYIGDSENMLYAKILEHQNLRNLVLRDVLPSFPLHRFFYVESMSQIKGVSFHSIVLNERMMSLLSRALCMNRCLSYITARRHNRRFSVDFLVG